MLDHSCQVQRHPIADRGHTGPTTIHRIDWSEYPAGESLPAASSGVALKGALRTPAGDSTLAVKDADRRT
jgi:hypothetical protein